jgi:hypothetical protein
VQSRKGNATFLARGSEERGRRRERSKLRHVTFAEAA